jgi:hypothetical protein
MDCLTATEVASDRFLEAQEYGVPGVRCRVIPYALPMPGATEQLKALIREARFALSGGGDGDATDVESETVTVRERPLSAAFGMLEAHGERIDEQRAIIEELADALVTKLLESPDR